MTRKAKQIGRPAIAAVVAGLFCAQIGMASEADKSFLPVPGEVTTVVPAKPVPRPAPTTKTNALPLPPPPAPVPEIRTRPTPATTETASSDWGTYYRERATKILLDGKLVDKSTLTTLIGFLVKEHATLSNGKQTFSGAALDLAARKTDAGPVATAMELRPSLWRRTEERVFLMNYKVGTSLPGALIRVYVTEIDPLEGWRTFKTGSEPSFEEWKRLSGR